MEPPTPKTVFLHYLARGREALVWKMDGLSEYDIRRPVVPTGTNLLGLVKHAASTEADYFGSCFGRPFPEAMPWIDDESEPNGDMWATADQSREWVVDLYARVAAHSTETIEALDLDTRGTVPWWGDAGSVTLLQVLTHVIQETHRHAGHADIVRELIDGEAGLRADNDNLPPVDAEWWSTYRDRLEQVARNAAD